jgi:hypothetical protein
MTYALVERRARWLELRPRTVWLTYFVVPTGIIGMLALAARSNGGLGPAPNPTYVREVERMIAYTAAAYEFKYNCLTSDLRESYFSDSKCTVGAKTAPRILLWGDSKAAQYVGLLAVIGDHYGFSLHNVTVSSCPAVLRNAGHYGAPGPICERYSKRVAAEIDRYDIVIAGSAWSSYEHRDPRFRDDVANTADVFRAEGKTVILLGDVPEIPLYNRECALRQLRLPMMDCSWRETTPAVDMPMNRFLKSLASDNPGVHYFDVSDLICSAGICSAYRDGRPIYYDTDHLSMSGSRLLGEELVRQGTVPDFLRPE